MGREATKKREKGWAGDASLCVRQLGMLPLMSLPKMENYMKTLYTMLFLTLIGVSSAHARTYHYACKNGDDRYALTVNENQHVVKLIGRAPTHHIMTFRIQKVASVDECAKYGWILSDNAQFCTATQGYGSLEWRNKEYECDQADTE
jgi:hypothetical protein